MSSLELRKLVRYVAAVVWLAVGAGYLTVALNNWSDRTDQEKIETDCLASKNDTLPSNTPPPVKDVFDDPSEPGAPKAQPPTVQESPACRAYERFVWEWAESDIKQRRLRIAFIWTTVIVLAALLMPRFGHVSVSQEARPGGNDSSDMP